MEVFRIAAAPARRKVLLQAACFACGIVVAAAWILRAGYLETRQEAEQRLRNLAQLVDRGITGSFHASDYVLRDVIGHVDAASIRYPDPDKRRVAQMRQMLLEKAQSLPHIYGIGVMNADCVVSYAAREAPGFDLAKRPYCQAMRGEPGGPDTFQSGVYMGQQNFLQMTLARKIRRGDGRLAGAALMRMDMSAFDQWLKDIDVGAHGSAALLDLDLNLAARRPATPQALGKPVADESLRRFVAAGRGEAIWRMRSAVDEVERIYIVRRVDKPALLIVLGLATEDVFAAWSQRAIWIVLATLALLGAAALAVRHTLQIAQQAAALAWRSQAIDASDDAVVITDAAGTIEYVNPAFTFVTGYTAQEVRGRTPRVLKSEQQNEYFYRRMWTLILAGTTWRGEIINRRKDGSLFHDLMTISPVKDAAGTVVRFVAIHHDITQRKRAEEELAQLAHFDRLTGLPNRALFLDRIERVIAAARREQSGFSLLFLDLDGFKAVNDSHGHEAGDRVLRAVADRIRACVRESDTAARLGGDEFAVLLRTVAHREAAVIVAQKIIDSVAQAYAVAGGECRIGVSVGVALHPDDGVNAEALLHSADFAMYEAKRQGKSRWICAGDLV
ncbi:MAG: diguanylate cyclase [Rhodocyclales bacterium]|nr:diguanylate cyclase [Rhodocyclales bacterium]